MGTVMNRKVPHYAQIDKVVGRTFHLPMPLEETLKKICPKTLALNPNQEMFIFIRGVPTKTKIVWEDVVNMKTVYTALVWLQSHNKYYKNIRLPPDASALLEEVEQIGVCVKDAVATLIRSEHGDKENKLNAKTQLTPSTSSATLCVNTDMPRLPLVTQKCPNDKFYENMTIYPSHEKKLNEELAKLFQMLKVHAELLHNKTKDLDCLCFPDLFPTGVEGQRASRFVTLRDAEFIKSKLMSVYLHFRTHKQYLFYALNDNNMRQLSAGIYHKLNIVDPKQRFTAFDCINAANVEAINKNLDTIFARLRGTASYWKMPRSNLRKMSDEYGPATFFMTISPEEWMWPDLGKYICEANHWSMGKSIPELIATDPVSTARFFYTKLKAFIKFLTSSEHPIGEVAHYYWVCEYQGRGLPHYHFLIWIKDVPVFGTSSNEEIQRFILQHITCQIPDPRVSPELHRRVQSYQHHKHNSYCMRSKKTKTGFRNACRFGFPRPVTKNLVLRDLGVAIAGRRKLRNKNKFYDLPRTKEEAFTNDYNPIILTIWEGNNDIQFISEKSYLITEYVTKGEKSEADISSIATDKSLISRVWALSLKSLSHRESAAQ
ncbi:hypothetical protein TKK_0008012 [Trichogramma kaykai]|uniref:Helitron helicase-like domain-containing protein n=1 Tax=Trichogramma kaykai TaxID=54128 RepID=A0ABD2X6Z2_9HYME